ncbi:hypothetical protein A4A49_51263 [Nicotiana attenuata]|uniref:GRF-type domain-containing protein n=1 Tax=Nicotiana attenuata TaxID=49451 RepID=A0A314KSV3_NICAT|nr:hypothetical protein A4A49_51263 [Nicotiana attenuata]
MAGINLNNFFIDEHDPMLNVKVRCKHGDLLPLETSWSTRNPGRQFWSCPYYGTKSSKFFRWRDDAIDKRSRFILP